MLSGLRSGIEAGSAKPITIYIEYLDLSRFDKPAIREALHQLYREKYSDRPLGVIVAFGAATLDFVTGLRAAIWTDVPLVFGQVDDTALGEIPPNTTGQTLRLSLSDMVSVARVSTPDLARVAILGDPLERQTAFRHLKDQIPDVQKQIEVVDLTGLTMAELLPLVSSLPDDSAILYTSIYSDGEGVYYPPAEALKLLTKSANRPIIVGAETFLGTGAIGGFLMMPGPIGEGAAQIALRILDGESARAIPVTRADAVKPIFDFRQLRHWDIAESDLPPGSEIRYRPPPAWRYAEIATYAAGTLLLGTIVTVSLYEHRKRRAAEEAARQRMSELALVNRHAAAGEMSAAIAHELNQPLGSILNDTEAATLILCSQTPDLDQLRELVSDIRRSDHRASEIIRQLRTLVSKSKTHFATIDLNVAAREAMAFAQIQARANGAILHSALASQDLPVIGDSIQLQQVFVNLIMNAIDAVQGRPAGQRDIVVSTSLAEGRFAEASVSDSGPGVSNENMGHVFTPFFSTKDTGMGVGLSLCRTLVEAHNGLIWAANGITGGAIFRFRLPLATTGGAS